MHIVLKRRGKGWSADIAEWPGSPYVGRGATRLDALAALVFYAMFNPVEEFRTTADSSSRGSMRAAAGSTGIARPRPLMWRLKKKKRVAISLIVVAILRRNLNIAPAPRLMISRKRLTAN